MIWRIPFTLAIIGAFIGLYVRLFLPESFEYMVYHAGHSQPKLTDTLNNSISYIIHYKFKTLYVFTLSCLGVATTFQVYIYGPSQAHIYHHVSDDQVMKSNIISLIVMLCSIVIFGKFSDKIQREKIILWASLSFFILSIPYFHVLSYGSYRDLLLIQSIISVPSGAYYATVPVLLTLMFPLNLRCTVLSFIYSIAASFSAGITPFISLLLLNQLNNAIAPVLLIFVLTIFVYILMGYRFFKRIRLTG
jgi:MHS family proline/betaine transporter-like MFS transporter